MSPASCQTGRRGRTLRAAFTLVELLIVISILALLISILMPSLGRAKVLARTLVCSTNLHHIGRAAHLYAAENNNFVPRDFWYGCNIPGHHDYGHYLFAAKLSHYLGGTKVPFEHDDDDPYLYDVFKSMRVYKCPSVTEKDFVLTYVVNGMDFKYYEKYRSYTSGAASSRAELPAPQAEIFYTMEANILMLDPFRFGIYDVLYPGNMPFDGDVPNWYPRAIRFDDKRHDGRTTVAFFDGHAEPRKLHPDELPLSIFNPYVRP